MLDSVSLWPEDINILPIDFIHLMDEEKAAATTNPKNILSLDDWRGRIISPENIHKTGLTEEIKETEQSPLKSNISLTSFRGSGLSPTL